MVDEYLTGGGRDTAPRLGWYVILKGQLEKIRDIQTCELLVKEQKILPYLSGGDYEKLSLNSFEDFLICIFSDGSFIIYR